VAVVGFVQSNQVIDKNVFLFGLTRVGGALILLSILGFVFGIAKEIQSSRDEAKRKQMLEELSHDVHELAQRTEGQSTSKVFSAIGERLEAIATRAPESILSRSDFRASLFDQSNFDSSVFRESNFARSDFSGANFAGSLFQDADFSESVFGRAIFRGADLSRIVIDEFTKLPVHENQPKK
jgi:hypothetical protein